MQSSSEQPLVGEERYVTTRITAAKETMFVWAPYAYTNESDGRDRLGLRLVIP